MHLKQSTSVVISFGPALDKTDGVTLETGLASAMDDGTTGIKISKNGGALAARHATVTATTYDAYGQYRVTLDTTDTNTLGALRMIFTDSATLLPIWQDFMILPANVWDSLYGSDFLQVDATQVLGTTLTEGAGGRLAGGIVKWFNVSSPTGTVNSIPDAVAGASGGLVIAGSNAATTFAGLTTGALSCTTITASGAVAFQSTFAVTTSTALAALSCTTLTASGAVAFQSTFAVTSTTTLTGNVSLGGTLGVTGTATFANGLLVNRSSANTSAVIFTGNGTGHGLSLVSGSGATGNGLNVVAASTDGIGANFAGAGAGPGFKTTGGADAPGFHTIGGSTSGTAFVCEAVGGTTAASFIGNVAVVGALSTSGTVTFNAFAVTTTTTLTGNVSLGGTLGVTGTTTFAAVTTTGTLTVNAFTCSNNFTVTGTTTHTGNVSLGGTLGVTGTTTLAALTTTGTVTMNALTVSNATTLSGAVAATNAGNDIRGITVSAIGNNVITAASIAADAGTELANAMLDLTNGVESGMTPRQAFRLMLAAMAGKLSGAATTNVLIRDTNDTVNRIDATVDANGNRTAVTYDVS